MPSHSKDDKNLKNKKEEVLCKNSKSGKPKERKRSRAKDTSNSEQIFVKWTRSKSKQQMQKNITPPEPLINLGDERMREATTEALNTSILIESRKKVLNVDIEPAHNTPRLENIVPHGKDDETVTVSTPKKTKNQNIKKKKLAKGRNIISKSTAANSPRAGKSHTPIIKSHTPIIKFPIVLIKKLSQRDLDRHLKATSNLVCLRQHDQASAKKQTIDSKNTTVSCEVQPSGSGVDDGFRKNERRPRNTEQGRVNEALPGVLEKLETTLSEIHQSTADSMIKMLAKVKSQLDHRRKERIKAFTELLDQFSKEQDEHLLDRLHAKARELLIEEEKKMRNIMKNSLETAD